MTSPQVASSRTTLNLTAIFTPPSSCWAPTYTVSPYGNDVVEIVASITSFTDASGPSAQTTTYATLLRGYTQSCYPPDFVSLGSTIGGHEYYPYYSPGLCPVGYSTVTGNIDDAITTATCCPSGFWIYDSGTTCTGTNFFTTVTVLDGSVTSTFPQAGTGTVTIVILHASRIVVMRQESDNSLFITTAATGSSSTPASTAAIATAAARTTSSGPPTATSLNHSLSTGARAGIGAGVSIGAILLFLGIFFFWRHRRKARRAGRQPEHHDAYGKPELDGEGKRHPELPEQDIREVDGVAKPLELTSGGPVAELEGNWQGHEMFARDGERL